MLAPFSLADDDVPATQINTAGSRIGDEVYQARFDELGGSLTVASQSQLSQTLHEGAKLRVECVFTTNDNVVFVLRILHAADQSFKYVTVEWHCELIVTTTTVTFAHTSDGALVVDLEPDEQRLCVGFACQLAHCAPLAEAHRVGVIYDTNACLQEFTGHIIHQLCNDLVFFFVVLWRIKEFAANAIALNVGCLQMLTELSGKVGFTSPGKAIEQYEERFVRYNLGHQIQVCQNLPFVKSPRHFLLPQSATIFAIDIHLLYSKLQIVMSHEQPGGGKGTDAERVLQAAAMPTDWPDELGSYLAERIISEQGIAEATPDSYYAKHYSDGVPSDQQRAILISDANAVHREAAGAVDLDRPETWALGRSIARELADQSTVAETTRADAERRVAKSAGLYSVLRSSVLSLCSPQTPEYTITSLFMAKAANTQRVAGSLASDARDLADVRQTSLDDPEREDAFIGHGTPETTLEAAQKIEEQAFSDKLFGPAEVADPAIKEAIVPYEALLAGIVRGLKHTKASILAAQDAATQSGQTVEALTAIGKLQLAVVESLRNVAGMESGDLFSMAEAVEDARNALIEEMRFAQSMGYAPPTPNSEALQKMVALLHQEYPA